jgi:molecular chaperone GrpE
MINKKRHTTGRIPVRFVDDEATSGKNESGAENSEAVNDSGHSPEELGRASSYEDATEMQRRIDRGEEQDTPEGREQSDDADTAGGPRPTEMPERRDDQDTNPTQMEAGASQSDAGKGGEAEGGEVDGGEAAEGGRKPGEASGPVLAELVATRAELKRVETELQKLTEERQDLFDRITRRQADFENYRKRMERERQETYGRVVADVVGNLLPVVDNLRRALDAESSIEASESEEFRHFLNGIELISRQLNGVLETLGVEVIPTVGEPFDPHIHEAVATEESAQFEADMVMEEMVRGYRLGDKLLRPAMVKVAK